VKELINKDQEEIRRFLSEDLSSRYHGDDNNSIHGLNPMHKKQAPPPEKVGDRDDRLENREDDQDSDDEF
jgi:hypothetical protein